MRYKNIRSALFGFVTKHACDRGTDGRTDGQNYDFIDHASIAASSGKKLSQPSKKTGFCNFNLLLFRYRLLGLECCRNFYPATELCWRALEVVILSVSPSVCHTRAS